jgi:uncharacterized cupin superfamily protein
MAPEFHGEFSTEELDGLRRIQQPGSEDELQLFEIRVQPNVTAAAHAHAEDEIIYVVSGELTFGSQVLTAGHSVYIPGMTLYSFRSGPEGTHFLNFRGRQDLTYFRKSEFLEMRNSAEKMDASPH